MIRCPPDRALSTAFSEGLSLELEVHLGQCPACRSDWSALGRLSALGAALPAPPVDIGRVERMRDELLVSVEREVPALVIRPVWPLPAAGGLLAAACVAVFVLWPSGVVHRGHVLADEGTEFVHHVAAPTARHEHDEIVRVRRGTVSLTVDPLATAERFRVITGDAEIEVRGTSFDVEVDGDRLQRVKVYTGVVVVRRQDDGEVELHAGESWDAATIDLAGRPARPEPVAIADPLLEAAAPIVVTARHRNPPKPQPVAALRHPGEQAFAAGWRALQAGDLAGAAAQFDEAGADPRSPLAEDASYWRGIALLKAARTAEAIVALDQFLARFPRSVRAPEAAARIGWLHFERGEHAEARTRFEQARAQGRGDVRVSAEAGLRSLGARF